MADLNVGSGPLFAGAVGNMNSREIRRAVMRFDLSGQIPAGATVNSVTLTMTVTKVPPGAVNSTFEVRKLLSDWDEGAVTWNSRLLDVLWESPGAEGPSDSSPNVSSTVPVGGQAAGYTFPSTTALVADVQDWVNNPGNNFGWLLEMCHAQDLFCFSSDWPHQTLDPANWVVENTDCIDDEMQKRLLSGNARKLYSRL